MTQAKSFLKEIDFTKQELEELIDLSIKFKQLKKEGIPNKKKKKTPKQPNKTPKKKTWLKYCPDF